MRKRRRPAITPWRPLVAALVMSLFGTSLAAQTGDQFSLDVMPGAVIPVGSSAGLYEFGFGAGLNARFVPGDSPLFLSGGLSFVMIPTQAQTSVTLLDAGTGPF